MIKESWRGVRPAMHYSYSRDEWLDPIPEIITESTRHDDFSHNIKDLIESGAKKQKLRAHLTFIQ